MANMFLRAKTRKKDGKVHRYWSVVESRRTADDRVLQRQVLYLGEINDSQKAAWTRAIEVFADDGEASQVAIIPDDRTAPQLDCEVVQIRLSDTLYRCLDKLLAHKKAFFSYLRTRWQHLFGARFEVPLYDQHLL